MTERMSRFPLKDFLGPAVSMTRIGRKDPQEVKIDYYMAEILQHINWTTYNPKQLREVIRRIMAEGKDE